MRRGSSRAAALVSVVAMACSASAQQRLRDAEGGHPMDREHSRHTHPVNPRHPAAPDAKRFTTSRTSEIALPLPEERDAFTFVVYGDRTGGPAEGVAVLKDSVRDTNLFEPDLVMTVGDLIQGYNQTPEWMEQMREFKGVMDHLICPWFPVAGNHDVYWRGDGRPTGEHEQNYEMHFGPLWYAFEHKNCWFFALYSDEGNPQTGEKSIGNPASQVMSDEQLAWLEQTLGKAKDADHVFLFLHHPRWRGGNYGDDWMTRVHPVLKAAGNVTAVFAGHIHRMKYQENDGIEYVTLATVGGGQGFEVPRAGNLHHFNVVTVRKDQVAMATVPVGEVIDPRELTEDFTTDAGRLAGVRPRITSEPVEVGADGTARARVMAEVSNPVDRPVEVMLGYVSDDSRWVASPDHQHVTIAPGASETFVFDVVRVAGEPDETFRALEISTAMDLLTPAFRYPIPESRTEVPLDLRAARSTSTLANRALRTGEGIAVAVASDAFALPDGPMTVEAWFNAASFGRRTGLVCKTESSDYGIFVSEGRPHFALHVGGEYKTVESSEPLLRTGRWHHVAGVFDGSEVRLYLDGALVASTPASGSRRTNALPLVIGGDVGRDGTATSFLDGAIDAVRVSKVARYAGAFTPDRNLGADRDTALLLHFNELIGSYLFDDSASSAAVRSIGRPTLVPAD